MAIIIPSANIYQKQNQKVVKNAIKKVFSDKNVSYTEKDFRVVVNTNEHFFENGFQYSENFRSSKYNVTPEDGAVFSVSSATIESVVLNFSFPKGFKNGKIQNVKHGYNQEDGSPNIEVKTVYDVLEEDVQQKISSKENIWTPTYEERELSSDVASFLNIETVWSTQKESVYDAIPEDVFYRKNGYAHFDFKNEAKINNIQADSSLKRTLYETTDNISSFVPIYDETSKKYLFNGLCVASKFQTLKMFASQYNGNYPPQREQVLIGTRTTYTPKKMEISIYGDTLKIEFNEEKMSFSSGEPSLNVDDNELFQSSSFVKENQVDKEAVSYFSQKIVDNYKEGKETAIIRCSISDYYDENGEKAININSDKLSFDIGNEVIPFVYNANGSDAPMSTYKDATPKKFRVVRIKFIYDGAVWQELTLQEV